LPKNSATTAFDANTNGRSYVTGQLDSAKLLDLTDAAVLKQLNITPGDLSRTNGDNLENYWFTQSIGRWAKSVGYHGLIFNSTRNPGGVIIAMFKNTPLVP
jgi:RES domain